ncbi:MAG: hypothetical protein QXD77_03400 [Candidatus Aenigmatarchaeota archaeon]
MGMETLGFSYATIAGIMAILLFCLALTQRKRDYYIFALVFLIASWSGLEYGLWLAGSDMFDMILYPAVPLDFFFVAWIAFAVWTGEKIKQRRIWQYWLVALAVIFAIARVCMNCVRF